MIYYLTTAPHQYPVGDYLKSWAGPSHPRIRILAYDVLPTILPRGTYIFSDLERLSSAQAVLAGEISEHLAAAGDGIRLLNHPLRALDRFTLLRALHEAGRNEFGVYRATEPLASLRFPVFLRRADDHEGALTDLLRDRSELDQTIVRLLLSGVEVDELLIVEFCDTTQGGDGLFRKYSAFRVGDRIVARHVLFSAKWMLKYPDLVDAAKVEEERNYLESNPHEREIRDIFDLAHIDYGRIDYGLVEGRIQVWEINTNPIVMLPREKYRRQHLPNQEVFASRIRSAFEAIDSTGPTQPMVSISLIDCARRIREAGRPT